MDSSYSIDRKHAPLLGKPQPLKISEPRKIMLHNTVPVYLIPDNNQEATKIDFIFDAGITLQNKKLQASAVNKLLVEGTLHHNSFEIAKTLDFYGAYIDTFTSKDNAGITLFGLTKYMKHLLPLVLEVISEATFPEQELETYLKRQKQNFLINNQKVKYKASLEFNELIFGKGSAYGQKLEESDFDNLCKDDLKRFYNMNYKLQNVYIVISGKITDALMLQLENLLIIENQTQEINVNKKKYTIESKENTRLISQPDAMQSALRIGTLTIPRKHPDFPHLFLLNTLLGGYFGSRLMSSLREEKGFTYGIYSYVQNFKYADYFIIATEVNANQTRPAIDEIYRQLDKISNEKVTDEELKTVKSYLYGSYLRSFDGAFSQAERFMKGKVLGLTFEERKQELNKMMKTSPEDLQQIAQNYLSFDKMKMVVVGNIEGLED